MPEQTVSERAEAIYDEFREGEGPYGREDFVPLMDVDEDSLRVLAENLPSLPRTHVASVIAIRHDILSLHAARPAYPRAGRKR